MVAPFGSAEKKLNMGAQLHTIIYIKPSKLFFKFARLNTDSVITNGDIDTCAFRHYLYEVEKFL